MGSVRRPRPSRRSELAPIATFRHKLRQYPTRRTQSVRCCRRPAAHPRNFLQLPGRSRTEQHKAEQRVRCYRTDTQVLRCISRRVNHLPIKQLVRHVLDCLITSTYYVSTLGGPLLRVIPFQSQTWNGLLMGSVRRPRPSRRSELAPTATFRHKLRQYPTRRTQSVRCCRRPAAHPRNFLQLPGRSRTEQHKARF